VKTNARTRAATSEPFVLDGQQRIDGFEAGITGSLRSNWSMVASWSHLRSEIIASANPLEEGAALALVPENSFNVWTDVRFGRGFSAGAGVQYMDAVFRNATNTTEVPSWWLLSATAAMEVNRSLTLRLNAGNLADARYVDRVGGGHYIPGAGRSLSISAEVGF
jgi:catecholate siderophore receptor